MKWKYCPHCGGELNNETEEVYGTCIKCSQDWYKTPPPATIALIVKDNKILLSKRGIEPHKGKWDFPGGFIRQGESASESMIREIKEELGLTPLNVTLHKTFSNPGYQYKNDLTKPLDIAFKVELPEEEPSPHDDVDELKWFSLEGDMPDLAFPHTNKILESLIDA